MAKTNKQRVLDYLQPIAPEYAPNAGTREATGISSHQQAYMLTLELRQRGVIEATRRGREWVFRAKKMVPGAKLEATPPAVPVAALRQAAPEDEEMTLRAFERLAAGVMYEHFGVPLRPGQVENVAKLFDMVSPDGRVGGDAKYYTNGLFGLPVDYGAETFWRRCSRGPIRHPATPGRSGWHREFLAQHVTSDEVARLMRVRQLLDTETDALLILPRHVVIIE